MEQTEQIILGNFSRGVHTSDIYLETSSTTMDSATEQSYQQFYGQHSGNVKHSFVPVPFDNRNGSDSISETSKLHHVSTKYRRGQTGNPYAIRTQQVNRGIRQQALKKRRRYGRGVHDHPTPSDKVQSQYNNAPAIIESASNPQKLQQRRRNLKLSEMFSSCFHRRAPPKLSSRVTDIEAGCDDGENAEVYYFDHGSPLFYRTTEFHPHLVSDIIAQRTQSHATKFWAEFFGFINVFVTFFITFFIQFYRFILHSIFRTIIVGFLQTSSDNLLKPILAVIFNGFLQLLFTFVQNIFQSICDMLHPLSVLAENVLKPFTECLRAFRIVDIRNLRKDIPHRHGENLA